MEAMVSLRRDALSSGFGRYDTQKFKSQYPVTLQLLLLSNSGIADVKVQSSKGTPSLETRIHSDLLF